MTKEFSFTYRLWVPTSWAVLFLLFLFDLKTYGLICTGILAVGSLYLIISDELQTRRRIRQMEREEMEAFMERATKSL